ncbi:tRNA pseudouridine(13) synthase TruD [Pseudoalteromonas luteoviolacea]|uniref:tRNA pseudouridine(13) synthase TruD n=1 Tax=Pseudoalteromonas luteoviolacea TaxID=43657 RepID=UPI00061D0B37|nr:tRNA pseudouridine(13) synthase TruD [Pseudoalteromonas luteoviolacea]AOT10163.1 tRNA pseudouridine synthase TruD [Pseudoalteromonas luteoviolacea]AOT15074.1 tRNA pseudouridine synthase TruD [Pseudoalteromonas luteoviolacea]AOT19990.1 tRNA pseudouridine synthase TruD [Pseudoalteromonas luteoviolacea]
MASLNYLYGKPLSQGNFKHNPEDFVVEEILDIEFTGEGEHVCLQIIKRGENTAYLAKQIAKFAGVAPRDVSYAGLKDRHGVCTQWFSVPVPIKKHIDFSQLNSDSLVVINQIRHNRKLKTGCHRGNRFEITLRNVTNHLDVLARINAVRQGVPNYFAEQRFGHDGHNLTMAERLFSGEHIRDKKLRGIVISAARSHIFNQIVSRRVIEHGLAKTWHREVFLLSGSNAFFEDDLNDDIVERLNQGDILLSAPLVGKGKKGLTETELSWLEEYTSWREGLAELGLKNERRSLRVIPNSLSVKTIDDATLKLNFELPKGCYATSVLRELIEHKDVSLRDKQDFGE